MWQPEAEKVWECLRRQLVSQENIARIIGDFRSRTVRMEGSSILSGSARGRDEYSDCLVSSQANSRLNAEWGTGWAMAIIDILESCSVCPGTQCIVREGLYSIRERGKRQKKEEYLGPRSAATF